MYKTMVLKVLSEISIHIAKADVVTTKSIAYWTGFFTNTELSKNEVIKELRFLEKAGFIERATSIRSALWSDDDTPPTRTGWRLTEKGENCGLYKLAMKEWNNSYYN